MWRAECQLCNGVRILHFRQLHSAVEHKSCGCMYRELHARANLKHGHNRGHGMRTKEYSTWASMIVRCTNKKANNFQDYGGRGIGVCDRWRAFDKFLADVGTAPSPLHTLDRINNDGNYEPGNVRWATREQQCANSRRSLIWVTFQGERMLLPEVSRRTGISYYTLRVRVRRGMSIEQAVAGGSRRHKSCVALRGRVTKDGRLFVGDCQWSGAEVAPDLYGKRVEVRLQILDGWPP